MRTMNQEHVWALTYIQGYEVRYKTVMFYLSLPALLILAVLVRPTVLNVLNIMLPCIVGIVGGVMTAVFLRRSFEKYTAIYAKAGMEYSRDYPDASLARLTRIPLWIGTLPRVFWKTDLWWFSLLKFLIVAASAFAGWLPLRREQAIPENSEFIVLILMIYSAYGILHGIAALVWKIYVSPDIKRRYGVGKGRESSLG